MTMVSDLPPAYCTLNESTAKLNDDEWTRSGADGYNYLELGPTNVLPYNVALNLPRQDWIVPEVAVPATDNEEETLYESSFEDKNTRIAFIQKVLSVTLFEMLAVLIVMICFLQNCSFKLSFLYNFVNYVICATLGYMFVLGLLIHCTEARWKKPFIYMFLVLYPVSFACFISILTYDILDGICTAWAYFCVVMLALLIYSVFALQSLLEFTVRIGFCVSLGLLIVLYAVTVPIFYLPPFRVLYPTILVFFLCSYILCDLEAMVEKHYRFVVTPADFVMGALIIHIDYLYIFTKWYKELKAEYVKM